MCTNQRLGSQSRRKKIDIRALQAVRRECLYWLSPSSKSNIENFCSSNKASSASYCNTVPGEALRNSGS